MILSRKIYSGSLVKHNPVGSPVEVILRKLSHDEIDPDFDLGIVIETSGNRSRVYSEILRGLFWYDNKELELVQTSAARDIIYKS